LIGSLVLMLAASSKSGLTAQSMTSEDVLDKRANLVLDNASPVTLLRTLSATSRVPIGIETIPSDSGSTVSIQIVDGTVRQVLDQIVKADPRYRWEVREGVINLLPNERNDSLLDVTIVHFNFQDMDAEDVPAAILALPEVQAHLSAMRIVASKGVMYEGPVRKLPVFSITLSNVTVKEILNEILRRRYSNFWKVEINGHEQKRVSIWL
jgi:hypothetical protein